MIRVVRCVVRCPHRHPPGIGDLGGDDRGDVRIAGMDEEVGRDFPALLVGGRGCEGPDEVERGRRDVDPGFLTDFADRRGAGTFTGLGFPTGVLVQTGAVFADGQDLTPAYGIRRVAEECDSADPDSVVGRHAHRRARRIVDTVTAQLLSASLSW